VTDAHDDFTEGDSTLGMLGYLAVILLIATILLMGAKTPQPAPAHPSTGTTVGVSDAAR
jgi:hypothetical protein